MPTSGASNAGPSSYTLDDLRTNSLQSRTVRIDDVLHTAQSGPSNITGDNAPDAAGQRIPFDDKDVIEDDELEHDDDDPFLKTPVAQRPARPSRLKPTPLVNVTARNRNNTAIKSRMLSLLLFAAFIGPFCELTKHPNTCSIVQVCHVAPRQWSWTKVLLIRALEYALGFPYAKMLNLDTRFNSMFLSSMYHVLFDYDGFAFLPLIAILKLIAKFTAKNESLPHGKKKLFSDVLKMPAKGWPIRILPVKLEAHHTIFVKILRMNPQTGKWEPTAKYRKYTYPYTRLPVLYTHVHPVYILLNTWDKLKRRRESGQGYPSTWSKKQEREASLAFDIVERWKDQVPPATFVPDPRSILLAADPETVEDEEAYRANTPPPARNPGILDLADAQTRGDDTTPSRPPPTGVNPPQAQPSRKGKERAIDEFEEDEQRDSDVEMAMDELDFCA